MTDHLPWPTNERAEAPLQVAMLLYPGLTLLDLVGPEATLSMHSKIHLVWKTRAAVTTDTGIRIEPNATFEDCPKQLDILFVPGGFGTAAVMQDAQVLAFLRDRGASARYITSVCSGSLILAAAGLLQGYKATSHWSALDMLAALGVDVVKARVVTDRNRISGGGVTAGIDFGLTLLAKLRGEPAAKLSQLALEYDPAPPFDAGSPESAGPEITAQALAFVGAAIQQMSEAQLKAAV
jgi:cyclohexyl-isocyanide hydratase